MHPRLHRIHSDLSLHDPPPSSDSSPSLHPSSSDCHLNLRLPPRTSYPRQSPASFAVLDPFFHGRPRSRRELAAQHSLAVENSPPNIPSSGPHRLSPCGEQHLLPLHPRTPPARRVKLMCSFGGKIFPRPVDGKLRYVGGESRIVAVTKGITLSEFMSDMLRRYGVPPCLKYQLPNEDLDALISVTSDEDFQNMMQEHEMAEIARSRIRLFFFSFLGDFKVHGANSKMQQAGDGRSCLEQEFVDAINGPSKAHHKKNTFPDDLGGSGKGENCGRLICGDAVNLRNNHFNEPSTSADCPSLSSSARLKHTSVAADAVGDASLQRQKEQLNRIKLDRHSSDVELDGSDGSACSSNASDSAVQHQKKKLFFIAADTPKDGDRDLPAACQFKHLYQCAHSVEDDGNQHYFPGSESRGTMGNCGISVPRDENWQCGCHIEPRIQHICHCMIGNYIDTDGWQHSVQQQQLPLVDMSSWNVRSQNPRYGFRNQPLVPNRLHQGHSSHGFMNRSVSLQEIGRWNAEHGTHFYGFQAQNRIPLHHPYGDCSGSAPPSPRHGVLDRCTCSGAVQHCRTQRGINIEDQVSKNWPLEYGDLPMRKNGHGCSTSRFRDNASYQ